MSENSAKLYVVSADKDPHRCSKWDGPGQATFSYLNPLHFDAECLRTNPDCPNCERLARKVDGLVFYLPEEPQWTPNGKHNHPQLAPPDELKYVHLADLYVRFKGVIETYSPEKNWDFPGAFFFAFTVITSIGYGNFVPVTNDSKLLITILTIPGVALSAYFLSQLSAAAVQGMLILQRLGKKWGWLRKKDGATEFNEPTPAEMALLLRRADVDGDGKLSLDEFLEVGTELDAIIGVSRDEQSEGFRRKRRRRIMKQTGQIAVAANNSQNPLGSPESLRSLPEGESEKVQTGTGIMDRDMFLITSFAAADRDGSGDLDIVEVMAFMQLMTQLRRFELTRSKAMDNVYIVGLLLVLLIVMGSLSFWWLMNDQHHTVLDAFYFTIVSITTVGLGDIVPSSGRAPQPDLVIGRHIYG